MMGADSDVASEVKLRVLLVDDHSDMLTMLLMMMKHRLYEVRTATSAEQALQLAPEFLPHVVVSDIGMPGMDGNEMMIRLRAMEQVSPFRSIALTGYDDSVTGNQTQAAGFDARLLKPVDLELLCVTIEAQWKELQQS